MYILADSLIISIALFKSSHLNYLIYMRRGNVIRRRDSSTLDNRIAVSRHVRDSDMI